jgi:hypothetical protein
LSLSRSAAAVASTVSAAAGVAAAPQVVGMRPNGLQQVLGQDLEPSACVQRGEPVDEQPLLVCRQAGRRLLA